MSKAHLMQLFYLAGITVAGLLSLAGADMRGVIIVSWMTMGVLNIVLGGSDEPKTDG